MSTKLQPVWHGMGCLREVTQSRRAHHGEICGGMHVDERDLRTARLPTPAEPPDRPARSPACDDVVIGVVRAQMMDAQNEVEACNLPRAWKVEYSDMLMAN
jgi:hypothetical protein